MVYAIAVPRREKLKKNKDIYQDIRAGYRQSGTYKIETRDESLVYDQVRRPATQAVSKTLFGMIPNGETIKSFLDLGCGTGSNSLSAKEIFPHLSHIIGIDQSRACLTQFADNIGKDAVVKQGNLLSLSYPKADLVSLSYVLGELSTDDQMKVVRKAWDACQQYLLLIMPGTHKNFHEVLVLREWLIEQGGFIVGPCPHDKQCPLSESEDWCHFSQKVQRSDQHRKAKEGSLNTEDEKFSYLLVSRQDLKIEKQARIIKKPMKRKGHIIFDLCGVNGDLSRQTISKKDPGYKIATKKEWGDIFDL